MNELIERAVSEFNKLDDSPIRIITHIDADGISSAAILARAFQEQGKKFVVSSIRQLDEKKLNELSRENYKIFFFTDLGSGYMEKIKKYLPKKKIFILDHHVPEKEKTKSGNIIHVNPHLSKKPDYFINLSGSGVTYFFVRKLDEKNKNLAHIALIGAMGDMHDIKGPNEEIMKDAVDAGYLEITKGLKMFGTQTKPIINLLRYNTDQYIPGVTGNEQGTLEFLQELGIPPAINGKSTKFTDLTPEQTKKLITGIILKRVGSEENPEDVLGDIYLLKKEIEGGPTKDIKEFATLLNACGRLGKSSIGIATCMGREKAREMSLQTLYDYKQELIKSMKWFHQNKDNQYHVIEKKGIVIINAEENIKETMIGTLASIISKSNLYPEPLVIISLAHTIDEHTKISMRIAGQDKKLNARKILDTILKKIEGGISGGHDRAAGALIPQAKEKEFMQTALDVCGK